jgi:hypothetical protein
MEFEPGSREQQTGEDLNAEEGTASEQDSLIDPYAKYPKDELGWPLLPMGNE